MNLSPAPNTPIRTPQHGSSKKALQLTPIWEEIVKNNRLPIDVNHDLIFKEISSRLEDLEWPVRQHAFRVLYDIIPILSDSRLDDRIVTNNIFSKIVANLGHPAPGIRKVAFETIQRFLKKTHQPEKMMKDLVHFGVKENMIVANQAGISRENITLGSIMCLGDILKPFIMPRNGGYSISESFLKEIIEALIETLKNSVFRDKSLETLEKLRHTIGDDCFRQILMTISGKEYFINFLTNGKDDFEEKSSVWSDETKSEISSEIGRSRESESFDFEDVVFLDKRIMAEAFHEEKAKESSDEFSDGIDTETYTKEPAPNDLEGISWDVGRVMNNDSPPSFVPIDETYEYDYCPSEKENKEAKGVENNEKEVLSPSSPRVVLEAEFQFSKNKAITMTVTEDEKHPKLSKNGLHLENKITADDKVSRITASQNEPDNEEQSRTSRRVRFGGEVIKLRTPDSDTTDITIEIHEPEDDFENKKKTVIEFATNKQENYLEIEEPETSEPEFRKSTGMSSPSDEVTQSLSRDSSPVSCKAGMSNCSHKQESSESAFSSSGSDTDSKEKWGQENSNIFWQWTDLRLVEENILKDLNDKENWKIQYQALEQLKAILINPKVIEKLEKAKNHEKLNSLLQFLLYKLPQSNNQQVTALSLSIVSQLIETLPKEVTVQFVENIVQGLCRYVGGCKNLNLKIESVQSLKTLFGVLEPSKVIDVLLGESCLFSPISKLRENSLLALMYATMMYPSTDFDAGKILEKVADSTIDIRRRVRHASLEAIAVLSQFCSSKMLADNMKRVVEKLPTLSAKNQLIAAVQARLSRRLLPTVSHEGLVLYALQIPASRRIGNVGSPMGADVDWILSGTGSLSTGSAKSRTQLNAAQRLEIKPSLPLSPNNWKGTNRSVKNQPASTSHQGSGENPWTLQKNRTELSIKPDQETHLLEHSSAGNKYLKEVSEALNSTGNVLDDPKNAFGLHGVNFTEADKKLTAKTITWALIPVSAMEEPFLGPERSNNLWGDRDHNSQYLATPLGPLRPLYLKLQPSQEQLLFSKSSDDVRRNSFSYGTTKGQEDLKEIRLLTPTILREKNPSDTNVENRKLLKNGIRGIGESATKIPVLSSRIQRIPRSTTYSGADRKSSEEDENKYSNSKSVGFNNISNKSHEASSAFLPDIHAGPPENHFPGSKTSGKGKFEEVDEVKLQDTMTQLSELLPNLKTSNKSPNRELFRSKAQSPRTGAISNRNDLNESENPLHNMAETKLFNRSYLKNHENLPNTVASAPAVINSESRDQIPSTSSSNSTDFGTLSAGESNLERLRNPSDFDNDLVYRNYRTYNSKLKGKKVASNKSASKTGISGNSFPESLKPFDKPKEGLDTCFSQLESQQWEVNMLGLISLIRLLRHHPAIILNQLHPIIVVLGRQIKNLRSQVARAACQASAEMFLILKRNVEPDLDELSGPLFHRSADTNRFIRADCNHALDNMTDNVGHAKAVNVIISKGTTHQNATVRAVAARLLLKISEKVGPEKLLSLPKETRDKMLQAGANLLMEGKLETRAFAKQVFRIWSSHPSFSSLILEAVPPNVMRHISKTLISIKT